MPNYCDWCNEYMLEDDIYEVRMINDDGYLETYFLCTLCYEKSY